MTSPDEHGEVTRRLLMLQRIPFLSELAPLVLASLAAQAKELSVSRGQIAPPLAQDAIRFFPDGTLCQTHVGTPRPRGFAVSAPNLVPWLAGAHFDGTVRAQSDGAALEVAGAELSAALEDEFSLYLAVAGATARAIIETQTRAVSMSSPTLRPAGSEPDLPHLTLTDRVLFLRETLPFARDHVGALVQLARHAAELRCDDGATLWREGSTADDALFVLRGGVNARLRDRTVFTFGPGTALGGLDVLARSRRRFTATAAGPVLALVLPVERFIDVLEDRHGLARDVLRALARALLAAWSLSESEPATGPRITSNAPTQGA